MKLCDYCETTLPDNASFCSQCGMILRDAEVVIIKERPVPTTLKDTTIKDKIVPNPETPIPDMAIINSFPALDNDVIQRDSLPTKLDDTFSDAPVMKTHPSLLVATSEALAALTIHGDPTPVDGQYAELLEENETPSVMSFAETDEETTSQNGYTVPTPLYADYGKATRTIPVPLFSDTTGDAAKVEATDERTPTTPAPLYDTYKQAASPSSITGSLMLLPRKIYTAYPQLLSRSGLISLTLCLLLILSSIGLILIKRPHADPTKNMYPIAAKLLVLTPTLNAEVTKGSQVILATLIKNSGKQPLHWTVTTSNAPWLTLGKQNGIIPTNAPPQTIYAKANTTTLAEGIHNSTIQFHTSGGDANVQVSITVLPFQAKKQPILSVDPLSITFDTLQQGQQATKTVTISNTGNAPLTWRASIADSPTWLSLSPSSGTVLVGGYPQPLILTVNTAALPPGMNAAQLDIFTNASKTPAQVGITVNVTASNGNALTISTNPGSFTNGCLDCTVLLSASAGRPGSQSGVNWSTSSVGVPGITFSPASGTLLAHQSIPVKVTVPNTTCPASAYFDFSGATNDVPVLWSCSPPPSPVAVLTASPTDLTNCTTCTVYISPAADSQSKLVWSSSSSGINGITFNPSSGTVPVGDTVQVTVNVPQQNCPANASFTFSGQGPNNSVTVAWSCSPPQAPMLSVDQPSLDSSQCQANSDGTYNCQVTLSESPAADMGWSTYSNVGGGFSPSSGQFTTGQTQTQVSINNIQCQDGTFGFLGSNNQVSVQWTCSPPNPPTLTVDTNNLSPNSANCSQDPSYGYDCVVTLGESFSGMLNWNESDNLGAIASQYSGQLTSGSPGQQVFLYYIPCQDGTFTFSTPNSNTQYVNWNCSMPTPTLTVDTNNLSPNSANCSQDPSYGYDCTVTLGESFSGTLDWYEYDNLGVIVSQNSGQLTPGNPSQQVYLYSIPCQNDTFSFSTPNSTQYVSWTCLQPTPSPTATPNLSVSPASLDTSNCSPGGNNTYTCQVSLSEDQSATVNWSVSDDTNLGVSFSQSIGTLNSSGSPQSITISNIPCQNGSFTFSALGANSTTATWNCSQPTPTPSPTVTPNLLVSPNSLDTSNCSSSGNNIYSCQVTLSEDQPVTVNWSVSDDANLGVSFSQSSGTLDSSNPSPNITISNIPCQSGTFTFSGSGANPTTASWNCSQPTPSPTLQTANLSVSPNGLNTSNCSLGGNNTYSCQVTLSEDQPVTINWSVSDDNSLGVSFSQSSGTLDSNNPSQSITISNIPCQNGTFTFSGSGANGPVTASWTCP